MELEMRNQKVDGQNRKAKLLLRRIRKLKNSKLAFRACN